MPSDDALNSLSSGGASASTDAALWPTGERWNRDWEFCFRAGEILLHGMMDRPGIIERRKRHFPYNVPSGSSAEAARFSPAIIDQSEWLASRWCTLFDDWAADPSQYVFPDGNCLLFFLLGLYANMNVLLRGQVDASWKVTTSLSRWRKTKGPEETALARQAADRFVARISEWAPLKTHYPKGLREEHREAICQHYGFPTEYVDMTFAYDVALFFAEDWKELGRKPMPACGAIYAIPVYAVTRYAWPVVLPPAVMRPTLQFGKFVRGDSRDLLDTIERHKFTYRHFEYPIAHGLSQTGFDAPPRLTQYLYPPSDPLEAMAKEFRSW